MGLFGNLFSRTGAGKFASAKNVLVAKYMVSKMSEKEKNDLYEEIIAVLGAETEIEMSRKEINKIYQIDIEISNAI